MEALTAIYPETKKFIEEKKLDSQNRCKISLSNHALSEASAKRDFKAHYHCGLLIHQRIAQKIAFTVEHTSLSELWQAYRHEVQSGKAAGQETFLDVLSHYSSDDFSKKVGVFISTKHSNPQRALDQLAE